MEQTKNPLDIAIDGSAYLVVQTPAGERFTRDGKLSINPRGQLVNASGYPVLGNSGPIVFQPTDKAINIAQDGNVSVIEGTSTINSLRGKLRLVSFARPQSLREAGRQSVRRHLRPRRAGHQGDRAPGLSSRNRTSTPCSK